MTTKTTMTTTKTPTTPTTMTTPTTTPTFLLRFTTLAVFFFTLLAATAQVQQFVMQQSDPITIQVDVREYLFTVSPGAQGSPLGSVEVNTGDYFSKDYSGYIGTTQFTLNLDDDIISFGKTAPASRLTRVNIQGLKETIDQSILVATDKAGDNTTVAIRLGDEGTPKEELSKMVQLSRIKDNSLIAHVTFYDTEGLFSHFPGAKDKICLVAQLQGSAIGKDFRIAKDSNGIIYALLTIPGEMARVDSDNTEKAGLNFTVLTPEDDEMKDKMGVTLVALN